MIFLGAWVRNNDVVNKETGEVKSYKNVVIFYGEPMDGSKTGSFGVYAKSADLRNSDYDLSALKFGQKFDASIVPQQYKSTDGSVYFRYKMTIH